MMHVYAIIMAGGSGTRLWPLSTRDRPKPFLDLWGEGTLISMTIDRLLGVIEPENILILAGAAHREALRDSIGDRIPATNIVIEPTARNTAACIALGALHVLDRDPGATICVFPADHHIRDVGAFHDALRTAIDAANATERIVMMGMRADRPDPGYGYIVYGEALGASVNAVQSFVEKPDARTARTLIDDGRALWNGGMFIARVDIMLREIRTHAPRVHAAVTAAHAHMRAGDDQAAANAYAQAENISIDHGVMERSRSIAVVPCAFGWDDIGTYDALHRIAPKDEAGNAVLAGDARLYDAHNVTVHAEDRLVVVSGVEDTCIVDSGEALYVFASGQDQRTREIAQLVAFPTERRVPALSIVVPTYNERGNIEPLLARIDRALAGVAEYEAIFVDDGDDGTAEWLRERAQIDARIVCVHRDNARGLASAVVLGFSMARGERIAVMDADLQHPPELLPTMLQVARDGADVVLPSRYIQGGQDQGLSAWRQFVSRAARGIGLMALSSLRPISDPTSGFFLIHRSVIEGKTLRPVGWKILMEVLSMGAYERIVEVPYAFESRGSGESKMSARVMMQYLLHIASLLLRSERDRRLWLFALIGCIGVGVDMGVCMALLAATSMPLNAAATIGALCAMVMNYLLNRNLTWRSARGTGKRRWAELARYIVVSGIGIGIKNAFVWGLAQAMRPAVANLCGIAAASVWNFMMNHLWVFRGGRGKAQVTRYAGSGAEDEREGGSEWNQKRPS